MRFRPCIDIHCGQVKQLVGSTLQDHDSDSLVTNFVSSMSAGDFARMYKNDGLRGGHVIMLGNSVENLTAAREALQAYPNGLQIGGGINDQNCEEFLACGASHVIITSYMFQFGDIDFDRVQRLSHQIGKEHLVLDLSCRKKSKDGHYYIMTNRWQTFTNAYLNEELLHKLATYCDEFLIHAVDVEGKRCGVDMELVKIIAQWSPIPVTYAGGARSLADFDAVKEIGQGKIDLSVGSALDIFGGDLSYRDVVAKM